MDLPFAGHSAFDLQQFRCNLFLSRCKDPVPRWDPEMLIYKLTCCLKLSGNSSWFCRDHDSGTSSSIKASTAAVSA